MRKYIALTLALIFVMAFAACSKPQNNSGNADNTAEPVVTEAPEITEAPEETEAPAPAEPDYSAYAEIVRQRIAEYGAGELTRHTGIESLKQLSGVSVVRLIDFDDDGVDELLLCCGASSEFDPKAELWTIKDGEAVNLEGKYIISTRDGTYIDIASAGGKSYIVTGWYLALGEEKLSFLTLEDGKLVTAYELCTNVDPEDAENVAYTINGEAVSSEEYAAKYNELLENVERFDLIDGEFFWSMMEDVLAETERVIAELGIEE